MASLWGEEEGDDDSLNNNGDGEEDILDMDGGADIHLEGALLMRFCPHDSSMLYPQVHNENSNSIVEYRSNEIKRCSILTNELYILSSREIPWWTGRQAQKVITLCVSIVSI
jgi:hypothetical protein